MYKRTYSDSAGGKKKKSMKKRARTMSVMSAKTLVAKETGYVDLAAASYVCDTTGSVTLLATVAQGASVNQRVGKKIAYKSLQCHGAFIANSAAIYNDCGMLIVYDKRPTGALPAVTDILVGANSNSFNNDANSGRFRILKRLDEIVIGNTTTVSTGQELINSDWYLDLKGLPCVFKAAASGTIADIEEGALYLVTVGNQAASATLAATFNGNFRTRFFDI